MFIELPIATADGVFLAHYSEKGLASLDFPNEDGLIEPNRPEPGGQPDGGSKGSSRPQESVETSSRPGVPPAIRQWHRLATEALARVLSGRPPKALPPLDWTGATEFQQSVWRQMLRLGPGKTKSYGEIAAAIGRPKAVRAVGGACGANPIPVLVPCHRILAARRKIGGFSGGLDWKRRLLAREGIEL